MSETKTATTGGRATGFNPQRTALLVIDPVNDFLSDAVGAESLPAYEASIHVNYPLIGNMVMEVDEFLAGLAGEIRYTLGRSTDPVWAIQSHRPG